MRNRMQQLQDDDAERARPYSPPDDDGIPSYSEPAEPHHAAPTALPQRQKPAVRRSEKPAAERSPSRYL